MSSASVPLHVSLADRRQAAGLSLTALAREIGLSRQALTAIEAGRATPSTAVALRLARALGCRVEDLFALPAARVPGLSLPDHGGARVAVGRVGDRFVAHPLDPGDTAPADGIVADDGGIELLDDGPPDAGRLDDCVLVAGCAPVLGVLAGQLQRHGAAARWLQRPSGASLTALAEGRVHVAGMHLAGLDDPEAHDALVRARLPGEALDIVRLVGWREGLAVAPGDPLGIAGADDLARSGLRIARRPAGAGATQVLHAALARAGVDPATVTGPAVATHLDAAAAVRHGAADVAVIIEPVADALGLPFRPLREERFELVLRRRDRDHAGVARLLDRLQAGGFVREVVGMGAYDVADMGALRPVEAA